MHYKDLVQKSREIFFRIDECNEDSYIGSADLLDLFFFIKKS